MSLKGGTLTAYNVFSDGVKINDVVDVKLPDRQAMTVTLSGTGVAGEVQVPLRGKYQSSECSITVGAHVDNAMLTRPGYINLLFKGSLQKIEPITGLAIDIPVSHYVKVMFKNKSGGNLKIGEAMNQEYTFEVIAWEEKHGGIVVFYIDKLNNIYLEAGTPGNIAEKINIGE